MIRKETILLTCISILLGLTGCRTAGELSQSSRHTRFPAGTWQTNDARWVFTLTRDGKIEKMTHYIGMEFDIEKGGIEEAYRDGITANYYLGPCQATFDPKTNELTITVVIEHYTIDFGDGTMEGSFYDHLTGPISPDGSTWQAVWTNRGEVAESESDSKTFNTKPERLLFTKTP